MYTFSNAPRYDLGYRAPGAAPGPTCIDAFAPTPGDAG